MSEAMSAARRAVVVSPEVELDPGRAVEMFTTETDTWFRPVPGGGAWPRSLRFALHLLESTAFVRAAGEWKLAFLQATPVHQPTLEPATTEGDPP